MNNLPESAFKNESMIIITAPDGTCNITLNKETKLKLELCDKLLENNIKLYDITTKLLKLFFDAKSILIDLHSIDLNLRKNGMKLSPFTKNIELLDKLKKFLSEDILWKPILTEATELQLELGRLNEKIKLMNSNELE